MEESFVFIFLSATCLLTYLISYIFRGISIVMFGITLMGIFLLHNNFLLFFIALLISSLLILRILKLKHDTNLDFSS